MHVEKPSVLSHSLAPVEGIMPILRINDDGNYKKNRRKEDESGKGKYDIEYSLSNASPWGKSDVFYLNHRDFAQKRNLRVDFRGLKRIRHISISYPVNTSVLKYLLNFFSRKIILHYENLIDTMRLKSGYHFMRSSNIGNIQTGDTFLVSISKNLIHRRFLYGFYDIFLVCPEH